MLKRRYVPTQPYRIICYARMSGELQNPRSPEQQLDTIDATIKRLKYPWQTVATYRDDAIKGKLILRRPGLMRMINDLAIRRVKADLIVVDSWERFGRLEEFEDIRRKLLKRHGILVVTADSGFADPTGSAGRALGFVENLRAVEENRVKSHNVTRGKKDALRRKRWAGGPPPLGLRLKKLVEGSGAQQRFYSQPEEHPEEAPVLRRVFQKALETGWGDNRLAEFFNQDPETPAKFKPFSAPTIGHWLANPLYIGIGTWGRVNTDIVDDTRVIEPNPDPEDIVRVEDYCQPIVDREVFLAVRACREARRRARPNGQDGGEAKLIEPLAPGLSLVHDLAGMVRCGECHACKTARRSGRKSKDGKTYTYWMCPRALDGACPNKTHDREDTLRKAVYAAVRQRLFPTSGVPGSTPEWFPEIIQRIRAELERRDRERPMEAQTVRTQIEDLDRQLAGWKITLGNPQLPATVRADIEADYEEAKGRRAELEDSLARKAAQEEHLKATLDPRDVIDALRRLDETMAGHNASMINIELARHIACIASHADGRVILRGTYLGVFEGGVELLSRDAPSDTPPEPPEAPESPEAPEPVSNGKVRPRRLARRRTGCVSEIIGQRDDAFADIQPGLAPSRFDVLPAAFVWEEPLTLPTKTSWAEDHAQEVLADLLANPKLSLNQIAERFGVTRPTISHALRIADPSGDVTAGRVRTIAPRGVASFRDLVEPIGADFAAGIGVMAIARKFNVSYPTLDKALDEWHAKRGLERPDGRTRRKTKGTAGDQRV